MTIRPDALVADIAAAAPATIAVFQRYRLEFCCGGRIPLADACAAAGLDTNAVLADLLAAQSPGAPEVDWRDAQLSALVLASAREPDGPRGTRPGMGACSAGQTTVRETSPISSATLDAPFLTA